MRQVTDPTEHLVVALGRHGLDAGPAAAGDSANLIDSLGTGFRSRGQYPETIHEQVRVGRAGAAVLGPGNRMAGHKSFRVRQLSRHLDHGHLDAAAVGHDRVGTESRCHRIHDRAHRLHGHRQEDEIGAGHGLGGIVGPTVDTTSLKREFEIRPAPAAADDFTGCTITLETHTKGAADQADAKYGHPGRVHERCAVRTRSRASRQASFSASVPVLILTWLGNPKPAIERMMIPSRSMASKRSTAGIGVSKITKLA